MEKTRMPSSSGPDAFKRAGLIALLGCALLLQGCVAAQSNRMAQHRKPPDRPQTAKTYQQTNSGTAYYTGYSQQFAPLRDQLAAGEVERVQAILEQEELRLRHQTPGEANLIKRMRLVGLMERGSLYLQAGAPDKALQYCQYGQELIEQRQQESILSEKMSLADRYIKDVTGLGELGRYTPPGYEKVMLLNLASMAYLLKGDDRAFNVARLAVEWQDLEKEQYEKVIGEIQRKEAEKARKQKANNHRKSNKIFAAIDGEFAKYDDLALSVPSAFVNPFADYVTGMVNEFKSVELKSLLSNAAIAYSQALRLNPESPVLQQAVKDTQAAKPASRLIHVVAMDGFVPEKKVLSLPLDKDLNIELPTYNPITSRVTRIVVADSKGNTLATLSPVADVEALAMRHQKDSLPAVKAMLVAATLRDAGILYGLEYYLTGLGVLAKKLIDKSQEPDTTSWMTLPARIMAARIYPAKGVNSLILRSYDSGGKKLAEQRVSLAEGERHFVLVRSIDTTLYAYPSSQIWTPATQKTVTQN